MAITQGTVYAATVGVIDRDDNHSSVTVYYPASNTIGNVISEVTGTLIPAIQGISNGVVSGFTVSLTSAEQDPAVLGGAPEESDVERKAVFVFQAANGAQMKLEVPSVDNTLVVDGTQVLDQNNAAVAAFISAITAAGVDGLAPVTYLNSGLTLLKSAPKKMHRRSSKG